MIQGILCKVYDVINVMSLMNCYNIKKFDWLVHLTKKLSILLEGEKGGRRGIFLSKFIQNVQLTNFKISISLCTKCVHQYVAAV